MTTIKEVHNIHGILLLNKPQGISSNKALQKVKHLFHAKKAGHTGSLDPLATGMLPLCFGEATKISQYLLDADKCYETTGLLGVKTNTSDSTGEVINTIQDFNVSESELKTILNNYVGISQQTPSMFSALKYQGTPLYKYARQGIEIKRESREIKIGKLELTYFNERQFSLTITCSKGTYIRNLVEDIGDNLAVGAHVTALHRLYTAGFENLPMFSIDELELMSAKQRLNCLIPMDKAVEYLPAITLSNEETIAIQQGKILRKDSTFSGVARLYNEKDLFIGLGEFLLDGTLKAKRLVAY